MTKKHKVLTVVLGVAAGVFALTTVLCVVLFSYRIADLEGGKPLFSVSGNTLSSKIEYLESEREQLLSEKAELEDKLADAGSYYVDEIAELKAQIESKTAEIAALEADIANYRAVFNVDVLAQARHIDFQSRDLTIHAVNPFRPIVVTPLYHSPREVAT